MALNNLFSLNWLMPVVGHKIDFSKSIRGLRGMPRRVLLIGHKLAAGTAALNVVTSCATEADAIALCGEGSMLLAMWRAAKDNAALGLQLDIAAVPPSNTAVVATTTIVVGNSGANVQQAGEVMLYIEGERVAVGVNQADTAATVATKLIAAVNAEPSLPVTAAATSTASEVRLTAKWGGLTGNDIDVRSLHYADDVLPAGLTLTIPALSGGATSPSLATLIAGMVDYRATEIVLPFTDSTSMIAIETEQAARWEFNNMADGQVVTAMRGTLTQIQAWLASRNSEQVHTIGTTKDCTSPWVTAAMTGAAIESSASIDPAVPYTDIVLKGYKGPRRGEHWEREDANELLLAGASPLAIAQDGSGSLLRVVTNYTVNTSNSPDTSKRELAWIKTMSYYRWFTVTEFQKYRGFKLAEYITESLPGQKIMTVNLAEEILIGIYTELSKVALVQNAEYYKQSLVVEIDAPNGKIKVQDEPVLVVQHYQTEVTSYPIAGHI